MVAAAVLAIAVATLAGMLAGGPSGPAYLLIYALALTPGLPIGWALFGKRHGAGWIAGGLIGYALTAVVLWAPVQMGIHTIWAGIGAWALASAISLAALRGIGPLVTLPVWDRRATSALLLVLLVVPLLVWKPFSNVGARDPVGSRRYRAYFTADFLWHVALTAELSRADSPPRNPYLARRPLNYYWAYFVLPATAARTSLVPSIPSMLAINATGAGLLFVSSIFVFAWCAVPRAGPAAVAVLLAVLAASAEGLHALWTIHQRGAPIASVRDLNIDAITSWFMQGLTVDGLPRSLWYTPQHAAACALSLCALIVPSGLPPGKPATGVLAGMALGLALIFSPFLGGAFSLIYGVTAVWVAFAHRGQFVRSLLSSAPAALPVVAALLWCVASGTFEGARGAVAIGLSRLAAAAPFAAPALALGPLLALALPGLLVLAPRTRAAIAALVIGLFMFYFVRLTSEPIWIGWRAGQIMLVTMPALVAATLAWLLDRRQRAMAIGFVALAFLVGLPTTVIDAYNAQDIHNTEMGPGFRWTVVVPTDTQAAVDWIRANTPADAVVQMSINPRGRETWTLIPTFAQRRMAAGRPISLLMIPEYERGAADVDALYSAPDAAAAAEIARRLRIDYVFVDEVERSAFGPALAKFDDPRYFTAAFRAGAAAVYLVR